MKTIQGQTHMSQRRDNSGGSHEVKVSSMKERMKMLQGQTCMS